MNGTAKAGSSRRRVLDALSELGIVAECVEFPAETRSAAQAAEAIGCEVAQIAKSVVLRALDSDRPVLVIASGAHRVCEAKVAALLGEPVGKADAAFVRSRTGFAIGGVAPIGHLGPVVVLVDRSLWALDPIWAAAGSPNSVMRLSADDLHRIPGICVADLQQDI